MPGVRQHFVPEFLIRRFTPDHRDKRALVRRLDLAKGRGQTRPANPNNEAVRRRYYRIVAEDGAVDDTADVFFDRLESHAAEAIQRVVEAPHVLPGDLDRFWLANFIASLKSRTPEGREQLRTADVEIARLYAETVLSTPGTDGPESQADERERLAMLADLHDDRIEFESSESREVVLMFMALEQAAACIMDELAWTAVTAPPGSSFVLSDHPVCHYDPTPTMDGAGAAFVSSDGAQTVVPIDRTTVLLLEPASSYSWKSVRASTADVDLINLLVYAQATECIWGVDQETVTRLHRLARRRRSVVHDFMPRRPRIWVTEDRPSALAVPTTFRARTPEGVVTSRAMVLPDRSASRS